MGTDDRAAARAAAPGASDRVDQGADRGYWDRASYTAGSHGHADAYVTPEDVARTERAEHGGVKVGAAFLGWLTAVGTAVVLTALLGLATTAVGLTTGTTLEDVMPQAREDLGTGAVAGAVVVALVLGLSFWCGGYAAARMARFDGVRQGVAVWLWALLVTVVVAALATVVGEEYDLLAAVDGVPHVPSLDGDLTTESIVAGAAVAVLTLGAAALGGRAGMRFHRLVDQTPVVY